MALSPGFADFAAELMAGVGKLDVKRMFGGATLSHAGAGFAVLDDDVIFLKADAPFAAELKAQGSKPWVHSLKKDGSPREMGYWSLPDTAADDPDEATSLARKAVAVARANALAKAAKAKPKAKK